MPQVSHMPCTIMSIFLSPSAERNFCFLLDKSKTGDSDDSAGEKVKIWVSKELLAVASPVFRAMFFGDFRESRLSSDTEPLYLPGKNDVDFIKFLNCLFPYPTQTGVDESNFDAVLPLADEYQVEILMKKCDVYYDKKIKTLSVGDKAILEYLQISLEYKLKDSIETCVPYVAALNVEDLAEYRLQNSPAMDLYNQFHFLVYEAKLRRMLHEDHNWTYTRDSSNTLRYYCSKCRTFQPHVGTERLKCLKFHICASKGNNCICGYDFD